MVLRQRRAGVLLHPSSLPGPGARGTLGAEAEAWVQWLAAAGFSVWQTLPLAPPDRHGSPYSSESVFAGDVSLLDGRGLCRDGLLSPAEAESFRADAVSLAEWLPLLVERLPAQPALAAEFAAFMRDEALWLDDYALYRCLRRLEPVAWFHWPASWRDRDPAVLSVLREEHAAVLLREKLGQFLVQRQWTQLRRFAHGYGVRLFGDLPFFVAHDSADVWAQRDRFLLDDNGQLALETGVPPDYFSASGQLWHMPHYDWAAMRRDGYAWWVERLRRQAAFFDLIRIDHFRGLQAAWAVPAGAQDARDGRWLPGPGADLLDRLNQEGALVAEDLGLITEDVLALRDACGLPGMRVFQFGFDGRPDNPHLPANVPRNAVVYSGTHDNDTLLGWYRSLDAHTRSLVAGNVGVPAERGDQALVQGALRSVLAAPAALAMLPMQDLLGLGSAARMNRPGEAAGNWRWRLGGVPDEQAAALWHEELMRAKRLVAAA